MRNFAEDGIVVGRKRALKEGETIYGIAVETAIEVAISGEVIVGRGEKVWIVEWFFKIILV